jgi:hypothetical protein
MYFLSVTTNRRAGSPLLCAASTPPLPGCPAALPGSDLDRIGRDAMDIDEGARDALDQGALVDVEILEREP